MRTFIFLLALSCTNCLLASNSNIESFLTLFGQKTGSGSCAPRLSCPPNITVQQDELYMTSTTGLATATVVNSNCQTPYLNYVDKIIDSNQCNTVVKRTWVATSFDNIQMTLGNNSCIQTIHLQPKCHLVCPEDICVDLNSSLDVSVLGEAFPSSQDCVVSDITYEDVASSSCNNIEVINRTWTAVFQGSQNCPSNCIQKITIGDLDAPQILNCPQDIQVETSCSFVYWEEPVVIDNCNNTILTSNYRNGTNDFPFGTTEVTYTAIDYCGNESTCQFNVSVQNSNTTLGCPDDIEVITDNSNSIIVNWDEPIYQGSCQECPNAPAIGGFAFLGSFNGSNYYRSHFSYNYYEAAALAKKKGGYIVSINSKEENDFLSNRIHAQSVLIGLSDKSSEGSFIWDSGEPLTYENWFFNQPNNYANQDFVEMINSGEWNDIAEEDLTFILEIECSFVEQISGPISGSELNIGTHTVKYLISDGCDTEYCCSFDINVINVPFKSVDFQNSESISLDKVVLFPNPTSDIISIANLEKNNINKLEILNSLGQKTDVFIPQEDKLTVDMSHLDSGIYYFVLYSLEAEPKVEKILKH